MGLRFFRRVKIGPGITLNLSKGGASVSIGPQGAHVTVGTSGARVTLGLPGTGLFWTQQIGLPDNPFAADEPAPAKRGAKAAKAEKAAPAEPNAAHQAWEDGVVALLEDRPDEAVRRLAVAWSQRARLPGGDAEVEVTVAPELTLALAPDVRGAGLAYAEALQAAGRAPEAIEVLQALREEADAPVVRVALAELALAQGDAALALQAAGRSTDPVVALYRARAKLALGRPQDALAEVARARTKAPPALHDDLDEVEREARAA